MTYERNVGGFHRILPVSSINKTDLQRYNKKIASSGYEILNPLLSITQVSYIILKLFYSNFLKLVII